MVIFIRIKTLLCIIGFLKFKHQDAKIEKILNITHDIVIFCCSTCFFLSPLWFSLFHAETFYEISYSFDIFICVLSMEIAYGLLLWKREQILELFAHFEQKILERNVNDNCNYIIQTSRFSSGKQGGTITHCNAANKTIEKWTNVKKLGAATDYISFY